MTILIEEEVEEEFFCMRMFEVPSYKGIEMESKKGEGIAQSLSYDISPSISPRRSARY